MAFSYGRNQENSPLLKLVSPNLLKIGRNNNRVLDGPIKLPKNPGDLLKKVEDSYSVFYNLWNTSMIPVFMKLNKWYSDGKVEIKKGDIVYFKKEDGALSNVWTVGKISEVEFSSDGKARRATVEYRNSSEDHNRTTDRGVRSLIKLFHIDDLSWSEQMAEVDKLVKMFEEENKDILDNSALPTSPFQLGNQLNLWLSAKQKKSCLACCCSSHCNLNAHGIGLPILNIQQGDQKPDDASPTVLAGIFDSSFYTEQEFEEDVMGEYNPNPMDNGLISLICSVNTNLDDVSIPEGF